MGVIVIQRVSLLFVLFLALAGVSQAQVLMFGLNPQHTQGSATPAQRMNRITWSTQINENLTGGYAHYGQPLVTSGNTVIIMVRTNTNGYDLVAYDGATGAQKYRLTTGYVTPTSAWLVPAQPVVVNGNFGTRLYYPGGGGTIWRLDNPDSNTPGTPTRIVFYGSEATYLADQANFDNIVRVNTPIAADSNGNLFFGTRTEGTAPAPLSTTQSHIVRIDGATETATYVECGPTAADANVSRITHGSAPALSNDEQTLYVAVKGTTSTTAPTLLALDATSLTLNSKVALTDPRNGNPANLNDISTASPMVAPDDDVYFGILANPNNGSRGWLLRFSGDLSVQKTPGGFGWDYTAGVIPASMVPSYVGTSEYLLFCKYNNYVSGDGNGINLVSILDPNSTQTDYHATAPGFTTMREVLTLISPSADPAYPSWVGAAREWCINAAAISPSQNSIYFNNEDGHAYRWDLSTNSLTESVQLNSGIGQPYVPTVIGPDGTIFTLNGGYMFAIGDLDDVEVSLVSSAPNIRNTVVGDSITFTATVSGTSGTPTGTVTFEDTTVVGYSPTTSVLAVVPLDANGVATYTTSALSGGAKALGSDLGNHRVRAVYSGDGTYGSGSAKLYQKVHAFSSVTTVATPSTTDYPASLTFNASVNHGSAGPEIPTGYVMFTEGTTFLAQRPLSGSALASYVETSFKPGLHTVKATYLSDTWFATSFGTYDVVVTETTSVSGSSSPSTTSFGSPTTLSATVVADDLSAGTPAGTVTFYDGATSLGTAPVNGSGVATLEVSSLSVGTHNLHATFEGDTGWIDSTSSDFVHDVTASTTTNVAGSPNPSTFGASVTFTATVTSAGGTPTGTVTFKEGATTLGSAAVDGSGEAQFSTSALTVGGHTITAEFTGTGGYQDSSGTTSQTVKGETETSVVSSPNPSNINQSVTFTATVAAAGGASGTPTGSVAFKEGATTLATVSVNGSGEASFSTSFSSSGNRTITAEFTASGNWLNSSGDTVHTVNPDTNPPSIPTGVAAASGPTTGRITVSWSASTDPEGSAVSYEVWRSNKADRGFSLITTTSSLSLIDNVGKKQRRYYYIIARDAFGNRSLKSITVNAVGANREP